MAIKITLGNAKGGVGKTIVTNLLGYDLAEKGYKVLFVDIDPQANTTSLINKKYKLQEDYPTLYKGLTAGDLNSVIIRVTDNISLIASDLETVNMTRLLTAKTKATYLKKYILEIEDQFDFIFFDVPPTAYSDFLNNALGTSDYFIIVTETSSHSFEGISQFYNAAAEIHETFNKDLDFLGVLINRREKDKETFSTLNQEYNITTDDMFFKNTLPARTRIAKYSEHGIYNMPSSLNSQRGYDNWDLEIKETVGKITDEILEKLKVEGVSV